MTETELMAKAQIVLANRPYWMDGQMRRSLRGILKSPSIDGRLAAYRCLLGWAVELKIVSPSFDEFIGGQEPKIVATRRRGCKGGHGLRASSSSE